MERMTITYKAIRDRAEDDAREAMPYMPTENTFEAWERFQQDVEAIDAHDVAHQSCEWDWVIYYARAMQLCQAVPSDVLSDAELEWNDVYVGDTDSDNFGLYEMGCQIATVIVIREIAGAVESIKDELIDLAETQMDQF